MTPAEIILRKNLVASGLSSDEWSTVYAGIRERAFFSSHVEAVRYLDTARTRIAEMLDAVRNADGAVTSRAQVVSDIMRAARESGIATGTGLITDPGSASRAAVIVDTNAGLAAGYARAEQANTFGARLAFPAQELVRIEERERPRDWRTKWIAKGGRLYGGRMIALKGDPIWLAISAFGHPYPIFDYNSGMGVEDVSFDEAVALGIIKDDYQPPEESPLKSFNDGLEAQLKVNQIDFGSLQKAFGDQIRLEDGKLRWRQDIFKKAFEGKTPFDIKLGCASPAVYTRIPDYDLALVLRDTPLIVTQKWLNRKRKSGIDHRDHFKSLPDEPDDIPLTLADVELLPAIWHRPDKVEKVGATRIRLSMKAADGGTYQAVVDCGKNKAELITFYKEGKQK